MPRRRSRNLDKKVREYIENQGAPTMDQIAQAFDDGSMKADYRAVSSVDRLLNANKIATDLTESGQRIYLRKPDEQPKPEPADEPSKSMDEAIGRHYERVMTQPPDDVLSTVDPSWAD